MAGRATTVSFLLTGALASCGGHSTKVTQTLHVWHGFVWNSWNKDQPCNCWTKVGLGAKSLPATGKNFLKPWFFIYTSRGRVSYFYFASRFVD